MEALKRLELCRTDERLWLSIATKKEGSLMTGAFLNMLCDEISRLTRIRGGSGRRSQRTCGGRLPGILSW